MVRGLPKSFVGRGSGSLEANVDSPRLLFALAVSSAALFGCGPLGTAGELSNGGFAYRCTSEGDPTCDDPNWGYDQVMLPDRLAVGSRFGVTYNGRAEESTDGAGYAVTVVPASPYIVERSGTEMLVKAPGHVALLGVSAGHVADFVHVHAVTPTALRVQVNGALLNQVALPAGNTATLRATLADAQGAELGGSVTYTWSSSDAAVLLAGSSYGDNDATLTAMAPGIATVNVSALGLSRDISVIVQEAP